MLEKLLETSFTIQLNYGSKTWEYKIYLATIVVVLSLFIFVFALT